jgi:urease accessory protein
MKSRNWIVAGLVLALAPVASAHPGHNGHGGFAGGLLHPLTGLDHILAMIAVGMWAVRTHGAAVWRLPLTFVGFMVLGGALARIGVPMPAVESTIAASVLVLGLILAVWITPPAWAAVALVGLFAVFHGYAHMTEIGPGHAPAAYAMGFVTATVSLHTIGIGLGSGMRRIGGLDLMRWSGAVIAACGLWLCMGALA